MNVMIIWSRLRRPLAVALFAAVFAYIFITPLCGWLFSCGCDWPWRGFTQHCNAFIATAPEKCAWCATHWRLSQLWPGH
ncbi:hypothetical protein [Methylocucumis oryzae]|uniref:Uncharacterized protein n=1 Tax=Methylocucumis oryzae TaxID=1632867 RepID=A0A0F3IHQ6_9GAMM|nr:hypothetical protein [Methylocucumis oryzae]KJV06281.1 hypothetical protein VZ94_12130 [Methylocucumis oryzae]